MKSRNIKTKLTENLSRVRKTKQEQGITLIALVITIIILIILATVTITLVFGEGGLIKRAQEGKELTEQAQKDEQDELKGAEEFINGVLAGTDLPDNPDENEPYVDESIAVAPEISEGMTPVKWNGSNWVQTEATDSEWYNYGEKKWANVVLGGATFNEGVLDESKTYSMLVWIPRYAYKINSQYHQNGSSAGEIDIVFIDTANKGKDGSKTYSTTYPSATTGGAMSDYVVHPAFDYGGTALPGFWVGKFESSSQEGNSNSSSGDNVTTKTVQIKGDVSSWRYIEVSNIFDVCIAMNDSGNPYGLTEASDPHMMKNSEWGAVAYLSQNATYGKGEEVWINNSSDFITGSAGNSVSASQDTGTTNDYKSTQGQNASTTGNVTGVYDMSGGAWEYVAAYVNNGHSNLTTYGSSLVNAEAKYKDVYSKGSSDSYSNNYAVSTPANGHYGDAVWETSNSGTSTNSWYSDYSNFPDTIYPFFVRGGYYDGDASAGAFYFNRSNGGSNSSLSFRVVVPVL